VLAGIQYSWDPSTKRCPVRNQNDSDRFSFLSVFFLLLPREERVLEVCAFQASDPVSGHQEWPLDFFFMSSLYMKPDACSPSFPFLALFDKDLRNRTPLLPRNPLEAFMNNLSLARPRFSFSPPFSFQIRGRGVESFPVARGDHG